MIRKTVLGACIALLAGPVAAATQLLTNGGFETGDFSGWNASVFSGSSGVIQTTTGAAAPVSGLSVAAATEGSHHVLTGQNGPGSYALTQAFTVGAGTTGLMLSFDMFSATDAGLTDGGLDPFCCGPTQLAQVDILTFGAGVFDGAASVAHTVLSPFVDGSFGTPYQSYSFEISPHLTVGSSYLLRFAQADNMGFMTMGVDNVSLVATTAAVPLPASGLLLLGAVGAAGVLRRRSRKG